jgi:hypothetical protein
MKNSPRLTFGRTPANDVTRAFAVLGWILDFPGVFISGKWQP